MTTYSTYFLNYILFPCCAVAISLIASIVFAIYFTRKRKGVWIKATPIMLSLCVILLILAVMFPVLPYVEHLPNESAVSRKTAVVQIKALEKALNIPVKDAVQAKLLTTDQGIFLIHSAKELNAGDFVRISYLPFSKCILDWEIVSEEETLDYQHAHESTGEKITPSRSYETGHEGEIIATIAVFFLLKELFIGFFRDKMTTYLLKKDDHAQKAICPRLFGILYLGIDELMLVGSAVISWVLHSILLGTLLSAAALGYGLWFAEIVTTRLHYNVEKVSFSSLSTRLVFSPQDVRCIQWGTELRVFGPVLKIILNSGKAISLPQLYFKGLSLFAENWKEY